MTKVIDPTKLNGTLKILALDAAKAERNKGLIDTDKERSIFENNARKYLEDGIATDYTENDLNNVLGIKKEKDIKEENTATKQEKNKSIYRRIFQIEFKATCR